MRRISFIHSSPSDFATEIGARALRFGSQKSDSIRAKSCGLISISNSHSSRRLVAQQESFFEYQKEFRVHACHLHPHGLLQLGEACRKFCRRLPCAEFASPNKRSLKLKKVLFGSKPLLLAISDVCSAKFRNCQSKSDLVIIERKPK